MRLNVDSPLPLLSGQGPISKQGAGNTVHGSAPRQLWMDLERLLVSEFP